VIPHLEIRCLLLPDCLFLPIPSVHFPVLSLPLPLLTIAVRAAPADFPQADVQQVCAE